MMFKSKCNFCGAELTGAETLVPHNCSESMAHLRKYAGTGEPYELVYRLQEEDFERIRQIVREELERSLK